MQLELIGPHPFALDEQGRQITRIGTLFPSYGALWTQLPGVHAMQRLGFIERVNAHRAAKALPPLTLEEEEQLSAESVDLIFEADHILIRPDPERMDLAFAADELLQSLVSKRQVKFLSVADRRVREAIKHRGECWRLSAIPRTREAKQRMVFGSKVGIHGLPDLLLQPADRHPLADLPGIREPRQAGRRRPRPASAGDCRPRHAAQPAGAA